jgi:hypothetical protein
MMVNFTVVDIKANVIVPAKGPQTWNITMDFVTTFFALRSRQTILVLAMLLFPLTCFPARANDPAPEIGTAVVVKRDVIATLGDNNRDLAVGGRVHRTELLVMDDAGRDQPTTIRSWR